MPANRRRTWYATTTAALLTVTLVLAGAPANAQQPVDAQLDWSPDPPIAGETVTFDLGNSTSSAAPIDLYQLDVDGDNTIDYNSTSPTINHTYPSAGYRVVHAFVTDAENYTDGIEHEIHVERPDADGDGVGDSIDGCPEEPGDPDHDGCPRDEGETSADGTDDELGPCEEIERRLDELYTELEYAREEGQNTSDIEAQIEELEAELQDCWDTPDDPCQEIRERLEEIRIELEQAYEEGANTTELEAEAEELYAELQACRDPPDEPEDPCRELQERLERLYKELEYAEEEGANTSEIEAQIEELEAELEACQPPSDTPEDPCQELERQLEELYLQLEHARQEDVDPSSIEAEIEELEAEFEACQEETEVASQGPVCQDVKETLDGWLAELRTARVNNETGNIAEFEDKVDEWRDRLEECRNSSPASDDPTCEEIREAIDAAERELEQALDTGDDDAVDRLEATIADLEAALTDCREGPEGDGGEDGAQPTTRNRTTLPEVCREFEGDLRDVEGMADFNQTLRPQDADLFYSHLWDCLEALFPGVHPKDYPEPCRTLLDQANRTQAQAHAQGGIPADDVDTDRNRQLLEDCAQAAGAAGQHANAPGPGVLGALGVFGSAALAGRLGRE